MTSFTCIHTNGVYQQYKGNICNRAFKCGSELPEYVALILRNGGSQNPDRWLRELRNNQMYSLYKKNPKILEEFLHIDIEQYIELMPMDIQEEYNMQMERKKWDMNKRNMIVNISGGQVNIAKDNATINAIQNNGLDGNEFETIIQAIKDNLSGLKKEDGDEILDVLEQVKEEIDKEKPKKSRLQNCLKLIAPMITIANGIPVLATNLQKLHDIIIQCIMNL